MKTKVKFILQEQNAEEAIACQHADRQRLHSAKNLSEADREE
mgnify:CR=1 FL=1